MVNQLCMKCNKNPAVIKITKINKGEVRDILLCQECAGQESDYQKKMMQQQNLGALLSNILKSKEQKESHSALAGIRCHTCGHSLEEYNETFLLGCPDCYSFFEEYMVKVLRKIHGSTRHIGKTPKGYVPPPVESTPHVQGSPDFEPIEERGAEILESEAGAYPMNDKTEEGKMEEVKSAPQSLEEILADLRVQLKEAIAVEDYKQAAKIRDQLKDMEK